MTISRHLAFATLAAPLALALAACGGSEEEGPVEALDPIAAPAGTSWTDTIEVSESDGYVLGNPDAPIKLIEYASLTCPACASFSETGERALVENYVSTGLVSYELRNQVHNIWDLTLASLVRCSAPESFHPLANQVWANLPQIQAQMGQSQAALQAMGDVPPEQMYVMVAEASGFLDFFASRGISNDQARACLADSEAVIAIGDRSTEQSDELGIDSTPTFILNGRVLEERSWPSLEPLLQNAGARPAES